MLEAKIRMQSRRIDLPGTPRNRKQGFDFGSEVKRLPNNGIIKGFFAAPIANQVSLLQPRVPKPNRKHTLQPGPGVFAKLVIQGGKNFRIAMALKPVSLFLQLSTQTRGVVDFPVLGGANRLILAPHGLPPVGGVKNAQAAGTQSETWSSLVMGIIGTSMVKGGKHPWQIFRLPLPKKSGDPTHMV